jgi:hypothetical protein
MLVQYRDGHVLSGIAQMSGCPALTEPLLADEGERGRRIAAGSSCGNFLLEWSNLIDASRRS